MNISIKQIEDDLNGNDTSPSRQYDSFKLINNLSIKTKDSVEQKFKLIKRRQNHHKSEIHRPTKNTQDNKTHETEQRGGTCEKLLSELQIDTQIRQQIKKNIKVSEQCVSKNNVLESNSSSYSSKIGSKQNCVKGILKKQTLESSFSDNNSRSSSVASGKSVKFNLVQANVRMALNQWK
ncbi:unnamed protein product (macronuclear) [Paramecium tetraurelia]|uniref:Uncharacterized protein n=1 Tax=Paramecium tetraurelia TaxID=5888 RepID=A0BCX0_PARTE|nr:uncharacterized protein GSPATT00004481001 [Paramecium tetraurelia]CAK56387.1 unnamed protein product [Paramecium tetraurelia]|eukprot:XP_001423785.1 hypothetical protein (macronuclear) [Paramecium tetraurelia strain d4-2]